jgi:hypothetical protein
MGKKVDETRILLAIQATHSPRKLSIRRAAHVYEVDHSRLARRIHGHQPRAGRRDKQRSLTLIGEEELIRYVINRDTRGFGPLIEEDVRDMANLFRVMRRAPPVGKYWPYRFVQTEPKLKMRFSRAYDYQRALCEDPDLIKNWFELVKNMRAKYNIQDADFYNFHETGFMMGVISGSMVVTSSERKG